MRDLEDGLCDSSRVKVDPINGEDVSPLTTSSTLQTLDIDLDWIKTLEQQHLATPGYLDTMLLSNRCARDNEKRMQSPSKKASSRTKIETISSFSKYVYA